MTNYIHVFFTDRDEFLNIRGERMAETAVRLTNYILEHYQAACIERIFETEYKFIQNNEQTFIIGDILTTENKKALYQAVYNALLDYIQRYEEINIDGFVRFRLQRYKELLEDMVERAVNNYIVEMEYNQLIEYLTMYVELQQPLIRKILITVQNNRYIVLDDQYQEILSLIDFEDAMLDILITMSPEIIEIYNTEAFGNRQLLKTIHKIFRNRVFSFDGEIPNHVLAKTVLTENPFQHTF